MRILFLTSSLEKTSGWGTYSAGFVDQAKKRLGPDGVDVPDPASFLSLKDDWLKPLRIIADVFRLLRRARKADAIHALVERAAPLAWLLSRLTGRPYLISAHGTYADINAYPRPLRGLYRRAFTGAKAIAAVSHYTASVVRQSFGKEAPVEVIPGGFTPAKHQPSAISHQLSDAMPRILSVGALKKRKGFHTLVEAMKILADSGIVLRCDIVGPTDEYDDYVSGLRDAIKVKGLEGVVTIHGKVQQSALDDMYAKADLFVLPSEHAGAGFEGLGLVYLEAMSYGVPAIGCLQSGAEDVIKDGVSGRLVPPGDPVLLAAAIKGIISDEAVWKKMSDAAPASIRDFAWDKVGGAMEDLYRKIEREAAV